MTVYNPHELIHYGIMGMHWGVRKAVGSALADVYDKNANREQQSANKQRHYAAVSRTKIPVVGKRISKAYENSASEHQRIADTKRGIAKYLRGDTQEQRQKRLSKSAKNAVNRPYKNVNKKQAQHQYKNVLEYIAVGTTMLAIGGLARPTADLFGKRIAGKVAGHLAAKAAAKTIFDLV